MPTKNSGTTLPVAQGDMLIYFRRRNAKDMLICPTLKYKNEEKETVGLLHDLYNAPTPRLQHTPAISAAEALLKVGLSIQQAVVRQ